MELPKPWSEGPARLAASAHLHYRVGSSLISEEIIRQNTKPFAKQTSLQVKEISPNKLTVETPKSWSEGLARLATGAHLHYRGSRIVAVISSSIWSGSHRHTTTTIHPRIYTSGYVTHWTLNSRRTWSPGNGNTGYYSAAAETHGLTKPLAKRTHR